MHWVFVEIVPVVASTAHTGVAPVSRNTANAGDVWRLPKHDVNMKNPPEDARNPVTTHSGYTHVTWLSTFENF
jgi:hypothetical protein